MTDREIATCANGHRSSIPVGAAAGDKASSYRCPQCGLGVFQKSVNDIELAARFVEKRRDDYIQEYGSYDPSTGVTEFPGNGDEYVGELEEIIEGIRALAGGAT